MTTKHDTGGPAWPSQRPCLCEQCGEAAAYGGMTLLDWFAGQAVASGSGQRCTAEEIYTMAAALVAEKRRREGEP